MINLYTRHQRKIAMLVLVTVLAIFLIYGLRSFISSFFGALIIYTLFRSWHIRLVEKKGWRVLWSTIMLLVVSFLLIILPVVTMVYQVASQVVSLTRNPTLFKEIFSRVQHHPLYERFVDPAALEQQLGKASEVALGIFSNTLNGVLNSFASIGVMYLILFFMFANYRKMEQWLLQYLPLSLDSSLQYGDELRNITYSNVIGSGIIAVVQGLLVGVGFWIFGIPEPFLYGTLAIFASFIPVIGAALIFIPGSIYAFVTGETWHGIGLLLWGFLLVANIDNLLRMVLNKKIGDTHPLITFLGIILGLPLFGLTGLVVGPLLLSFFVLSVNLYIEHFVQTPTVKEETHIPTPPTQPEEVKGIAGEKAGELQMQ